MKYLVIFLLFVFVNSTPCVAVEPDEMLSNEVMEKRAREISKILRCLVCQNQSIDESDSPLARDLRLLVRERLKAGDSDKKTIDYIVKRYGNFVLLKPPFNFSTFVLWLSPPMTLFMGIIGIIFWYRRRKGPLKASTKPLSAAEHAKLKPLLRDNLDR